MKQLYYVIQTLLRGRSSNIIKIVSLGLGLTMSILLFARVAFEQSFDTCYKDNENLYQIFSVYTVGGEAHEPSTSNCGPVAGAILENFPEQVEAATSICEYVASAPLYNGNHRFNERKVLADSLFFRTMGIEVLSGDPERDLMQKDVIYLSDRLAKKIFGNENPVGKTVNYGKEYDLIVKGTYADLPENATMNPDAVISMPTMWSRNIMNYSWSGGDSYPEYIRFRPGADKEQVKSRLDAMIQKYRPAEDKKDFGYTAFVAPIRDTYRSNDDVKRMGSIMSILGFAILFIVTLNYVLISISSLSQRAKMVGVHKCSGASGGTIFSMFLLETGIIIVLALLLMAFILLNFTDFFEDTAALKLSVLFAPERIWVPALVVLFLFIVGGVLPGRLFSKIPVSQVFRRYTEGKKGWKRPLLFIQFAGVAFICGLMCVVMSQYTYVMNKSMGYNPERIVASNDVNFGDSIRRQAAYNVLKDLPYVEDVSWSFSAPIYGYSGAMISNAKDGKSLFTTRYDYWMTNYPEIMGMTLKEGRMGTSKNGEVLVNETFAKYMHWGNDILGRTFYSEQGNVKVVGVLKDFHIESFRTEQMPFVAYCYDFFYGAQINLRLKEPFTENLQKLNKDVAEAFPDITIDFDRMEKHVAQAYNPERVFRNATMLAAVTMFFVMLMGLIGYTTDEVRRRSKEIAIRKVNGAEVSGVLELLVKDVFYVAAPAVIIGTLASWYINGIWMDQFVEKVPINWAVYPLLAIANLAVIIGCVLWKSWKIANENPVNSIKSE